MDHQPTAAEKLFENTGIYIETSMDLLKLKTVEKSSGIFSSLVYRLIIMLTVLVVLLFLGVGIALFIGDELGRNYYGFFAVAGFYCIAGIVVYLFRKKWILERFSNLFVTEMLN